MPSAAEPAAQVAIEADEAPPERLAPEDREPDAQPRDVERLRAGGQRDRARLDLG